ncbi:MAG: hypothetical protein J2P37_35145 [Ktedonobacteraceae bacterium]|nr:hypothetical protein [Ktedonobacteraceae bacterium]
MQVSQRPIFRDKVVKHYMQRRQKDSLPRFISWPIPIFLWLLLGILLAGCVYAWYEEVPIYVNAPGMIVNATGLISQKPNSAVAMLLLSPQQASHLHVGQPVKVQVGSTAGPEIDSTIAAVEPGVVSPYAIRKRFGLGGREALMVAQPSVVVLVSLEALSPTIYAGSVLTARVEIGTQRLLAFLPGLGSLVGK